MEKLHFSVTGDMVSMPVTELKEIANYISDPYVAGLITSALIRSSDDIINRRELFIEKNCPTGNCGAIWDDMVHRDIGKINFTTIEVGERGGAMNTTYIPVTKGKAFVDLVHGKKFSHFLITDDNGKERVLSINKNLVSTIAELLAEAQRSQLLRKSYSL